MFIPPKMGVIGFDPAYDGDLVLSIHWFCRKLITILDGSLRNLVIGSLQSQAAFQVRNQMKLPALGLEL
jgi:hypothetical protein